VSAHRIDCRQGLLDAIKNNLDNNDAAYRPGAAVWYAYRCRARQTNTNLLGRLEGTVLDLPHFLAVPPSDDPLIAAPIGAVAVWDTVGALAIPEFTVKMEHIDAFPFADRLHGLHAIAVDERGADFTRSIWDADARITQVLFPGSHAGVG
jgi:hypothetical protein